MIQYNDIGALQMCENLPDEIEGVSIGDFSSPKTIDYRFTRDNNILDYYINIIKSSIMQYLLGITSM